MTMFGRVNRSREAMLKLVIVLDRSNRVTLTVDRESQMIRIDVGKIEVIATFVEVFTLPLFLDS
jgi:hypothetical protein